MMRVQSALVAVAKRCIDTTPVLYRPACNTLKTTFFLKNCLLFSLYQAFDSLPPTLSASGQDKWVIDVFQGKRAGFFLDLGAADGFSESNTFILEKRLGWTGICIEPNPKLHDRLLNKSRRSCMCVSDPIDAQMHEVEYVMSGVESGLVGHDTDNNVAKKRDQIEKARRVGSVARMQTRPLADVLDKCNAPKVIDYFSFDVEGAETRILRNFPFDRYTFLAMTIERPTSELNRLLFSNGYHFVRNSLYDTFFIHETIPNFASIERRPFEQQPPKPWLV